ncbi:MULTISPECIES: 3-hydroxyacyl-CoA dehydrogenase NAD-binding domain-containing protein [Trueperella]|uniref:3-hydroxyacyl-CoA dehydrogenase n=1 Tax=Trueperella abortisuis TaxID=445930 RepID=A0ABT9PG73_9ACTO|nr:MULTISPECIES: 3-hydroxyacyl-CoA dehydrogenase NAD-binding domain-containing protein [Trueperella]MCI7305868.1 3-hydroxyacyl-CoA dehydrogenase NAD-binding domain-containing protein [Trueperella sp.]MDP9831712.1 3-hydroxyacyl-CoA dehydrogenase [Trueperella abortisuis]MDY5403914.1 3-hydroxyacyl-CoA dehydrogenase NAD-binding domain-containing protein [Trueperella sp.]
MSVAILGAGAIGVSFAARCCANGIPVFLLESNSHRAQAARSEFAERKPTESWAELAITDNLGEAVSDAYFVIECITERLDAKRNLFAELDPLIDPDRTTVASSSSVFLPSDVFSGLNLARSALVAHPLNPPEAIPMVELVPAPATSAEAMKAAEEFYSRIGMSPVKLNREIAGYVSNRLQAALLREAYLLVRDGIINADGVDTVVRSGLGRRWAFYGPFEVADLNTRGGIDAHAARLGDAYGRQAEERGSTNPWRDRDLIESVTKERRHLLPIDEWDTANAEREAKVRALSELIAKLEEK